MVKNIQYAWYVKQSSLTAALAHCQAGRTRQDRKQAGLRELLGEEKKIVLSS